MTKCHVLQSGLKIIYKTKLKYGLLLGIWEYGISAQGRAKDDLPIIESICPLPSCFLFGSSLHYPS